MSLDFDAIRKAYDNVVTIDDTAGAFDANGNPVSLDQSKLNAEDAAVKYKTDRTRNGSTKYASFGDQLDMLYADMLAGKLDTTGTWATHIKSVKDANPKP